MTLVQEKLDRWNIWHIEDKELLSLLVGRKGGKTTIAIIDMILKKPQNKNQLAKTLNLDYKTVAHHITIMKLHNYLLEEKYNKTLYLYPSPKLFKSLHEYRLIKEFLLNEIKREE